MDKIIGLGKLGCAIAEELTAHPEYRIYKIDTTISERGSLALGELGGMDDFESKFDSVEAEVYLRSIRADDEVLLVVQGGEPITGCTLKLLSTIKDAKINVLYVCPDRDMISETQKRDDKIAFNILQEYARSGVFEKIFLVKKPAVESLMGDVSIHEYEKNISYFISYVLAMINYFNHTDPIVSNKFHPVDWCRIVTFGVSSLEEANSPVNYLFPLESVADLHFFYGVPKDDLEKDPTLMKRIKDHVKHHQTPYTSTSFSVYSTTFDNLMVLCVATSGKIQPFELLPS